MWLVILIRRLLIVSKRIACLAVDMAYFRTVFLNCLLKFMWGTKYGE